MAEEGETTKEAFVVMTPMHREITSITAWCIEKAHSVGIPFMWMPHPGDALIGRARSIMATWALEKSPSPYTIMLDSDIVFEPGDLAKLWEHLKSGKYELIGGVYTVRHAQQLAHYGIDGVVKLDGQVQEIKYLSTGFMGFTRGLLQKMVDELELPLCHKEFEPFRCYPFFESAAWYFEEEKKWIYRSEDWDFCDKASRVGVKPMLDTSILLGHEGVKQWRIEDLPKERVTPISPIVLPGQMPNRAERRRAMRELKTPGLVLPNIRSR